MLQGDRLGRTFRAVRLRLRLRQVDVARRADVSAAAVSRIERGRLDEVSLSTLSKVADALEIRIEIVARWRSGDLDRMLNAKHAALAEDVVAWLRDQPGWKVRPEVSFNVFGERGVIDLLAWHAPTRTLLVIELKTDIVDVGEHIGTFDRKRRLARRVAADLGWRPAVVGVALLVRGTRTNRRRVAAHELTLRAALPDDGRRLRAWLTAPSGELVALAFVPDRQHVAARQRPAIELSICHENWPSAALTRALCTIWHQGGAIRGSVDMRGRVGWARPGGRVAYAAVSSRVSRRGGRARACAARATGRT